MPEFAQKPELRATHTGRIGWPPQFTTPPRPTMRDTVPKLPPMHTGRSAFLVTNQHMAQAIWQASQHCHIESSEDIIDVQNTLLWKRGKPVTPELLEKLADRELRKPIELCVMAQDSVSAAMLETALLALCRASPDFAQALVPRQTLVLNLLHGLTLNPQELLLISVLRFGRLHLLPHTVAVTALALAAGMAVGLETNELRILARAALLHDVGLLYLPEMSGHEQTEGPGHRHPLLGAMASLELASCPGAVGQLIALSHERLDGTGFPAGTRAAQLSLPARVLALAEAVADTITDPKLGAVHAAMKVRLVPEEFDSRLVNWMASVAHAAPAHPDPAASDPHAHSVGLQLRQVHSTLSRMLVLLILPVGETPDVRQAAGLWLQCLRPLMQALSSSGVEIALAQGLDIEPESQAEAAELYALTAELSLRLQAFARSLAVDHVRHPEFAASRLVHNLTKILDELPAQAGATPVPCPPPTS
jgi:hypothetical protein